MSLIHCSKELWIILLYEITFFGNSIEFTESFSLLFSRLEEKKSCILLIVVIKPPLLILKIYELLDSMVFSYIIIRCEPVSFKQNTKAFSGEAPPENVFFVSIQ